MNRIKIVGLTGQSGAGKSTVSAYFAKNGMCVINADEIVKNLLTRLIYHSSFCPYLSFFIGIIIIVFPFNPSHKQIYNFLLFDLVKHTESGV